MTTYTMAPVGLRRLRRVRWAVRAALTFGVAASVAANVLHAQQNPISQSISAWPPLALLLTVELVSRVPVHRRSLAVLRVLATAVIAGIAAWVSYWHMQGVATRYGETDASPYLLPISVDGLIVVASICLVELAGRIRTAEIPTPTPPIPAPAPVSAPIPTPAAVVPSSPAPTPVTVPSGRPAPSVLGNGVPAPAARPSRELSAAPSKSEPWPPPPPPTPAKRRNGHPAR